MCDSMDDRGESILTLGHSLLQHTISISLCKLGVLYPVFYYFPYYFVHPLSWFDIKFLMFDTKNFNVFAVKDGASYFPCLLYILNVFQIETQDAKLYWQKIKITIESFLGHARQRGLASPSIKTVTFRSW